MQQLVQCRIHVGEHATAVRREEEVRSDTANRRSYRRAGHDSNRITHDTTP
jgi:hypothetical protein